MLPCVVGLKFHSMWDFFNHTAAKGMVTDLRVGALIRAKTFLESCQHFESHSFKQLEKTINCCFLNSEVKRHSSFETARWLPSWELTYPPKMAFWRWFSFSQGGICQFPGGSCIYINNFVKNLQMMGLTQHLLSVKSMESPETANYENWIPKHSLLSVKGCSGCVPVRCVETTFRNIFWVFGLWCLFQKVVDF